MKRWIHAASERQAAYQEKQLEKKRQREGAKIKQEYVDSIKDTIVREVEDRIYNELYRPVSDSEDFNDYVDNFIENSVSSQVGRKNRDEAAYHRDLINSFDVKCELKPASDCMQFCVSYTGGREFGFRNNLLSLASFESDHYGPGTILDLSRAPVRVKRKMNEYKQLIAEYIEDSGLEVLGPAKSNGWGQFVYPVIDNEYEKLI